MSDPVQSVPATTLKGDIATAARNVNLMHTLERLAAQFNAAGVPLMALKGAALNLTLYHRPDERPMSDLDLLVRPRDLDRALALLKTAGGVRGQPLVRDDFFPRFYSEIEFTVGTIRPVRIDLHVRPLRPLRYSRVVPEDALWERAECVRIGPATVLVPCSEDMLIHLAAHSALHGNARRTWLKDVHRWAAAHRDALDWDRFIETVRAWRLAMPVREAILQTETDVGPVCPPAVMLRLLRERVSWKDRLATCQAPRDATHPLAHVATDVLCTPGWHFALAYLWAMAIPGREHMAQWYGPPHRGWLPCAHALRLAWPVIGRIPRVCERFSKIRTRTDHALGTAVFAKRQINPGETITRCRGKVLTGPAECPGWSETRFGRTRRYAFTGKLSCLNHSERPNAKVVGRELVATRAIAPREEVTVDFGGSLFAPREEPLGTTAAPPASKAADAA